MHGQRNIKKWKNNYVPTRRIELKKTQQAPNSMCCLST